LAAVDKRAFVATLAQQHGKRLRRFLAARLRDTTADIPDLAQEVFLRLLRVPRHESIRSPQAYLFTVAFHVLHQHKLKLAATPESVELMEVAEDLPTLVEDGPASRAENQERLEHVDRVLRELSPKAYAAFVLHRRHDLSLDEIAARLHVSRAMVKKYLAKAMAHCQMRLQSTE
jgi:RNA polymerase sigma factor (sigma-70 family)